MATGFLPAGAPQMQRGGSGPSLGGLLVGVPSPDSTPEMACHESCHLTVSSGMLVTGCGLILCASLGVTYGLVTRLLRHTPGEAVRQATH